MDFGVGIAVRVERVDVCRSIPSPEPTGGASLRLRNGSGITAVGEIGSGKMGESEGVPGKAAVWNGSLKGNSRGFRPDERELGEAVGALGVVSLPWSC